MASVQWGKHKLKKAENTEKAENVASVQWDKHKLKNAENTEKAANAASVQWDKHKLKKAENAENAASAASVEAGRSTEQVLDYSKQLREQVRWLDQLIAETEKACRAIKVTDDRPVRISKRKNGYQYYLENDDGKLEYISKKDIGKVKRIVQRDYYSVLKNTLTAQRKRLERFLKVYDIAAIEDVYENLGEARRALVVPLVAATDEFVNEWRENHPGGQNPFPDEGKYRTDRGEFVRSKTEKILADMFEKNRIPYVYEPELRLQNGKVFYPDFALLNVRTRETFYWEHFGLISDGEYARHSMAKLNQYEHAGLNAGTKVLFSMESEKQPLSLNLIEKKIRDHLK